MNPSYINVISMEYLGRCHLGRRGEGLVRDEGFGPFFSRKRDFKANLGKNEPGRGIETPSPLAGYEHSNVIISALRLVTSDRCEYELI